MTCKSTFALWSFRFMFFVASLLFCTNFNIGKNFDVIKYPLARVYCIAAVVSVSTYYCFGLESTREFFYGSSGRLTLIYFEFNFYWFASLVVLAANIANQNQISGWYAVMMDRLSTVESGKVETVAVLLLLCYSVDLSILAVYVPLSFEARSQPDSSVKALAVYYALCGVSLVTVLQIATGTCLLAFVFNDLRLELSNNFTRSGRSGFDDEKAKDITRKYQSYYSLALDFNKYFSVQILVLTTLIFVELTYSTYYMLNLIDLSEKNLFLESDKKLLFSLCFFAFYFVQLIEYAGLGQVLADQSSARFSLFGTGLFPVVTPSTLVWYDREPVLSCDGVVPKPENTSFIRTRRTSKCFDLVSKVMAETINELSNLMYSAFSAGDSEELQETLEIFMIQKANLKVDITAADFFKVDNGLIFKMVGLISSTTVILVQFSIIPTVENCFKNSTTDNSN